MLAAVTANVANAGTISIGWREDGNAITTVAGSGVSSVLDISTPINTGNFVISSAGGSTQGAAPGSLPAPGLLFSNNTSVSGTTGAAGSTLDVFITASGLTGPLGNPLQVLTGFTQNLLLGGFTTTLSSFLSATNQIFTGTALSSSPFAASPAANAQTAFAPTGNGPYSVTAQYHIVNPLGGAGGANSNVNVVGVPGPVVGAGLPGLFAACFGLAALVRRRRNIAIA